jgi:methylthioribose-1-phosphate isomerase
MRIKGKHYRTIWEMENDPKILQIIDQRLLPFNLEIVDLKTLNDFITAIKDMYLRGAPLIGVAAGYAMYIAGLEAKASQDFNSYIKEAACKLIATRPTAVNLAWAVNKQLAEIANIRDIDEKIEKLLLNAREIAEDDVEKCKSIGNYGSKLIEEIYRTKKETVNILTHCNAGWLATVDYGTATAPIYTAFHKGIPLHVWVDETRPRNQGSRLTAFELLQEGVPHYIIADNTGGHLMQHGMVDIVIVGSDRTALNGDVANKIGTYLKALAAKDNNIPFYAAMPTSTIDINCENGVRDIPIEQRDPDEVKYIDGFCDSEIKSVLLTPSESNAVNYGFDVTPARLISGIITEKGICSPDKESILKLCKM